MLTFSRCSGLFSCFVFCFLHNIWLSETIQCEILRKKRKSVKEDTRCHSPLSTTPFQNKPQHFKLCSSFRLAHLLCCIKGVPGNKATFDEIRLKMKGVLKDTLSTTSRYFTALKFILCSQEVKVLVLAYSLLNRRQPEWTELRELPLIYPA